LEEIVTKRLRFVLFAAFSFFFVISPFVPVLAQETTGWAIRVSMISTIETPDAMNLKVYFSVYDPKTDLAILDVGAKGAQIALPQTNYLAAADFKKPDVPIYVVMVLDASGSMSGAAPDLKKAAKLALNNTPDNSYFSVVQFNEEIKLIQDYTQNIPAVSFAIDQYQVANKGTCMYDATYSAVESLQKAPPGRRAIILFTDGRDENTAGKPCSKHTYLELSDFAQKSQIPISTIGLSYKESGLNEVELKGIASSTGGYTAIGKQADMAAAFQNIMNGLKSQWMVETNVYPKKGTNQVVMNLSLKENQTIGTTFNVESQTDYPGPPSPVSGRMSGLEFIPENLSYNVQLTTTSPELVGYINVEVWDVKGGSKVAEYKFNEVKLNNTYNISSDQLVVGREYELRMTAINKTDQTRYSWASGSEGKKSAELIHPFVFDPTANLPSLTIQSIAQSRNDLVLTVKSTNSQLIGGFDGWLVNEETNTQVPDSNFTNPTFTSEAGSITIPLSKTKVPAGKYTAIVRVLGKNGQVFSTAKYEGITYKPTLPNLIELITAALIAAPIIVVVVIAIILAVVGFLMYSSNREKSLSGTPVLQGRLGGKIRNSNGSSESFIPVADKEPILIRNKPPAVQQPGNAQAKSHPENPQAYGSRQGSLSAHSPIGSTPIAASEATIVASPISSGGMNDATILNSGMSLPRAVFTILKIPQGIETQGEMVFTQSPFIIGRAQGSLLIRDTSISRQHVQIDYLETNRTYFITDLQSSNGTRLNNQLLIPGKSQQLTTGSLITLGQNVTLRFDLI